MVRIAILSDIHANLPAFEAVLRDVEACAAERIVFLGDIVGYGSSPVECVNLVRKLGGKCVMGNHDVEIGNVRKRGCTFRNPDWRNSGYQAGLAHAGRCLDADQAAWLAALPYTMRIPGAIVAHASLDEPEAFNYIQDDKSVRPTLEILRKEKIKVGFFGHTHVAGIFADDAAALEWLDETRVKIPTGLACAVTVGAVGQPRGEPDHCASWVLWDPVESVVEFRRVDYSRLEAAQEIVKAGLPWESAYRLLTDEEVMANVTVAAPNQRSNMEKERVEGLTFLRPKNPIPKAELVVGAYYSGVCRNASVARWDGKEFWYLRSKFRHLFIEPICHRDDDEHYDVFDAEYRLEGDELAEAKPIEFPVKH